MYLKTNAPVGQEHSTGACGGLFPFAPKMAKEQREIGYWRKNYKLNEFLLCDLGLADDEEDDNCVDLPMSEEEIEATINFAKEEKQILEEGGDGNDGWYEVSDWDYTIKTFKEALRLRKEGYDVFYHIWY